MRGGGEISNGASDRSLEDRKGKCVAEEGREVTGVWGREAESEENHETDKGGRGRRRGRRRRGKRESWDGPSTPSFGAARLAGLPLAGKQRDVIDVNLRQRLGGQRKGARGWWVGRGDG